MAVCSNTTWASCSECQICSQVKLTLMLAASAPTDKCKIFECSDRSPPPSKETSGSDDTGNLSRPVMKPQHSKFSQTNPGQVAAPARSLVPQFRVAACCMTLFAVQAEDRRSISHHSSGISSQGIPRQPVRASLKQVFNPINHLSLLPVPV